jgi:hypothetical protein
MEDFVQDNLEDRIRERAHAIWEAQGHPDGLEQDHWAQAEAEIAEQDAASGEAALPSPLATGAAAAHMKKPGRRKSAD